MPRLILNMIVKNEADRIERCLASAIPHIDAIVILDTGSTDNTKALIAAFAALHGIPCQVFDGEFRNFSQARNEALDYARAFAETFDPAAYLLLMDADMELAAEPAAFAGLSAPAYHMVQRAGIDYRNTRLVRADVPAEYRGYTHEYLSVEGVQFLGGPYFIDHADGANRPGKVERDIDLLTQELAEKPDDPRALFYIANSHADLGAHGLAVAFYDRRVAVGGWPEEVWMSLLKSGRSSIYAGHAADGIHKLLAAHQMRPHRAEALWSLAEHYRARSEFHAGLAFAAAGLRIGYPADDSLFIETPVYDHGMKFEFSVCAYYAGDPSTKELGRHVAQALAVHRGAPDICRYNLAFWARNLVDHAPSFKSWRLPWVPPEGWSASNPGLTVADGKVLVNIRSGNYTLHDDGSFTAPPGESVVTRNYLTEWLCGHGCSIGPVREIAMPLDWPEPLSTRIRGFEDLRIVPIPDGRLQFSATNYERTPEGWCEIAVGIIETVPRLPCKMSRVHITTPDGPKANEKNWMPVDDKSGRFIYKVDPTRLVDNDGHTISEAVPTMALDHLRGGSPLIPFDGGWLCATHEVCFVGGALRKYLHRWCWFDAEFVPRKVSHAFTFTGEPYEYCGGLAWSPWKRSRLLGCFGRWDREAHVFEIEADDVRAMLILE